MIISTLIANRPVSKESFSEIRTNFGAVVQLGERLNGIQEARGSSPLGSI